MEIAKCNFRWDCNLPIRTSKLNFGIAWYGRAMDFFFFFWKRPWQQFTKSHVLATLWDNLVSGRIRFVLFFTTLSLPTLTWEVLHGGIGVDQDDVVVDVNSDDAWHGSRLKRLLLYLHIRLLGNCTTITTAGSSRLKTQQNISTAYLSNFADDANVFHEVSATTVNPITKRQGP